MKIKAVVGFFHPRACKSAECHVGGPTGERRECFGKWLSACEVPPDQRRKGKGAGALLFKKRLDFARAPLALWGKNRRPKWGVKVASGVRAGLPVLGGEVGCTPSVGGIGRMGVRKIRGQICEKRKHKTDRARIMRKVLFGGLPCLGFWSSPPFYFLRPPALMVGSGVGPTPGRTVRARAVCWVGPSLEACVLKRKLRKPGVVFGGKTICKRRACPRYFCEPCPVGQRKVFPVLVGSSPLVLPPVWTNLVLPRWPCPWGPFPVIKEERSFLVGLLIKQRPNWGRKNVLRVGRKLEIPRGFIRCGLPSGK